MCACQRLKMRLARTNRNSLNSRSSRMPRNMANRLTSSLSNSYPTVSNGRIDTKSIQNHPTTYLAAILSCSITHCPSLSMYARKNCMMRSDKNNASTSLRTEMNTMSTASERASYTCTKSSKCWRKSHVARNDLINITTNMVTSSIPTTALS